MSSLPMSSIHLAPKACSGRARSNLVALYSGPPGSSFLVDLDLDHLELSLLPESLHAIPAVLVDLDLLMPCAALIGDRKIG